MDRIDQMTINRMMSRANRAFYRHLAIALDCATDEELAAIKHALPEVFEKYRPPGIATTAMVEPPHGHDFSYPVEKVTP